MAIRVKVLYFAQAREAAGTAEEEYSMPSTSPLKALVERAFAAHRRLAGLRAMRLAINEEIAEENERLVDGDVVAFLPPVAGG